MGVHTDGSVNEEGMVGVYVEGGKESARVTFGKIATLWDGEVYGVGGELEDAPREFNVLILSDAQAAIAVVKKAGRTG